MLITGYGFRVKGVASLIMWLGLMVVIWSYVLWSKVGLWCSRLWEYGTQLFVILSAGLSLALIYQMLPLLKVPAWLSVFEEQKVPSVITMLHTNHTVQITGPIGLHSCQKLQEFTQTYPKIEQVQLTSPGGNMSEALCMAQQIQYRALNTIVDKECSSSCTFLFLAGHHRRVTPTAKIGFHLLHTPSDLTMQSLPGLPIAILWYRSLSVSPDLHRLLKWFMREISIITKSIGMQAKDDDMVHNTLGVFINPSTYPQLLLNGSLPLHLKQSGIPQSMICALLGSLLM